MPFSVRVAVALAAAAAVPAAAADLPWLPPRASATLALEMREASAESFHAGDEEVELSFGAIETELKSLRLTYSLTDSLAIDASAGEEVGGAPVLGTVDGENGLGVGLGGDAHFAHRLEQVRMVERGDDRQRRHVDLTAADEIDHGPRGRRARFGSDRIVAEERLGVQIGDAPEARQHGCA